MLIAGCITLAVSALAASEKNAGDGLREWGLALCVHATSYTLFALRGSIPDFLSIDVEGLDIEIIKSIDFVKYRPKVICVETIQFSPKGNENIKNYDIINYLKEMNYYLYADTNINSIFIDNNFFLKI